MTDKLRVRAGGNPLPSGILTGISSPWRSGKNKQWRCRIWSRHASQASSSAEVPWGLLPTFWLGQPMELPRKPTIDPSEKVIKLRIDSYVPVHQCSFAAAVSTSHDFPKDEKCVVFSIAGRKWIIPTLTILSRILAPTKFLTLGILEPSFIDRFVDTAEYVGGAMKLSVTRAIPLSTYTTPLVSHLARILDDPSFYRAWQSVRIHRGLASDPGVRIPLSIDLSCLRGDWLVRAQLRNDMYLVQEIVRFIPHRAPTFSCIEFSHPDLRRARIYTQPDESNSSAKPRSDGAFLDADESAAPRNRSRPIKVAGTHFAISDGARVLRVAQDMDLRPVRKPEAQSDKATIVSTNELCADVAADTRAVEFGSESRLSKSFDLGEEFAYFSSLLAHLDAAPKVKSVSASVVTWDKHRPPCVIAFVQIEGVSYTLIEPFQSESQRSTLIVSACDYFCHSESVQEFFPIALGQNHWSVRAVDEWARIQKFLIEWDRHRYRSINAWAKRLIRKMQDMVAI